MPCGLRLMKQLVGLFELAIPIAHVEQNRMGIALLNPSYECCSVNIH